MPVVDRDRRTHAAALVVAGACVFGLAVAGTAAVDESLRSAVAPGASAAASEPPAAHRVADHPDHRSRDPRCDPGQRV